MSVSPIPGSKAILFFGWGIGIVAHALAVFGRASRFVAEWEDRKIKELVAEQR